jgi:hypothetical protein
LVLQVSPIQTADVPRVARFLHSQLNDRVPPAAWERAVTVPWKVAAPNHGFMLVDGTEAGEATVVGAYLAFYSEREIGGRTERFCNLGAWCVAPAHRYQSVRLLKALLAQDGYHFTDLSPSGSVVPLNTRLKFQRLDTTTALLPGLPWPSVPGRYRITGDPAVIEATLTGSTLDIYRDHAAAGAARHLVLTRGDQHCYVMFRKDRRKGLPVFASILYASNPQLFRALARPLARHLLIHHGALATLAELRITGGRPRPSLLLGAHRHKMFRSDHLRPDQIDNLYSELACLAW